jgi:hypothetical protein
VVPVSRELQSVELKTLKKADQRHLRCGLREAVVIFRINDNDGAAAAYRNGLWTLMMSAADNLAETRLCVFQLPAGCS